MSSKRTCCTVVRNKVARRKMTSLNLPLSIERLGNATGGIYSICLSSKNFHLPSMSTCRVHSQTNNIKSGYYSTTSLLARILTAGTWRTISLVEIYSNHARQPDQVHG